MTKKIAVIGAGISGLSAAYWLDKKGCDVSVFEKSERTGGSIVTIQQDGFLIDLGPNSALETSDTLKELIREIGLEDDKIYANEKASKRYIVKNGQMIAVPLSPLQFLKTRLFSAKAKLRLLKEPFIKPTNGKDISLADFVRHRLGQEFLDYAINPFVAGVYAGDPENLSTKAAFPKLYALEQKYGSFIKGTIKGARERKKRGEISKDRAKLFSFRQGMQKFTDTLAEKLAGKIFTGHQVQSLKQQKDGFRLSFLNNGKMIEERFDQVILSTPAAAMGSILKELAPEESAKIAQINYPPVTVVYTGFEQNSISRALDGFGFLVPKKEQMQILGSIWSSSIFPERAPQGFVAFTTFIGGTRQPENAAIEDDPLTEIVKADLDKMVGINKNPVIVKIKRWPRAIPQYTMGYPDIQKLYDGLEEKYPGLWFAGNFRRGIGLGDSVLSAHETTQKILQDDNLSG